MNITELEKKVEIMTTAKQREEIPVTIHASIHPQDARGWLAEYDEEQAEHWENKATDTECVNEYATRTLLSNSDWDAVGITIHRCTNPKEEN